MTFQVAASPSDENELETFGFAFLPDGLALRLVGFHKYARQDEFSEWELVGKYVYPDVHKESTLQRPEVPNWALQNARAYITQQIKLIP